MAKVLLYAEPQAFGGKEMCARAQMFSCLCADVFPFVRTGFPNCAQKFYCPQLWVVQPITVSCTTHNCGLYNPQLWAVEFVLTSWKTCEHVWANICWRPGKIRRTEARGDGRYCSGLKRRATDSFNLSQRRRLPQASRVSSSHFSLSRTNRSRKRQAVASS